MLGSSLSLDTIQHSLSFHVRKWTPELAKGVARDILDHVVACLWNSSRGDLRVAEVTIPQTTLGSRLGISRVWTGTVLARLNNAGWLVCRAPFVSKTMQAAMSYRIGPQLKRLLIMLEKSSQRRKTHVKLDDNSTRQIVLKTLGCKTNFFTPNQKFDPLEVERYRKRDPIFAKWFDRGRL